VEAVLGERKELVRSMVRDRLLAWAFSNRLRPCFALLSALADLGDGAEIFKTIQRGDELILLSVVADMTNGSSAGIREAVEGERLGAVVGPERAFTVTYLYIILKALLNGNDAEIREAFRHIPDEDRIYPPFRAQALLNIAAYQLGIRDLDSALNSVKTAFVLSQNAPWTGLAQSNRLFSLVNLAKQRMGETVDYAGFAVEHAEKASGCGELALASYYAAVVQTLYGNLSQAERLSASAEEQALAAGRVEWADRARFFRGKLAFDLGRYQDALRIFRGIAEDPMGNSSAEKLSLLEAWAYRARIYSLDFLLPRPVGGGLDAALFEIEGACLARDYVRAVDLSAALAESLPGDTFVHTEQPDWRSGFAQCELLLLPGREFWDRMVLAYRALALCRLSATGGEEAARIMQRVLRDERLSEMDPCDAFYFYAWYQVLRESGAPQVDMNTAVSMAFKRLQRRASRIDDPKIRQAYFTQPRWNGALSLAAREHKLI
jgi:tetratricopeptide (TPR) repeat protein